MVFLMCSMNILGWAIMVAFGANAATRFIAYTQESTLNSLMDAGKHYGSCDCYFIVITYHDSFGLM